MKVYLTVSKYVFRAEFEGSDRGGRLVAPQK
jgi:hypothetical protein